MITVTTVQTRPSIDVEFYIDTVPLVKSSLMAAVNTSETFAEAPTFEISEDGLSHTSTAKYNSLDDLNAFLAELEAVLPGFIAARDAYSSANGISILRSIS